MATGASPAILLNFYRASELHGSLILGQLARQTDDAALMLSLTRHSSEDMMHSTMWAEALMAIGGTRVPVIASYHTLCAREVGVPASPIDVMVLTQIFEWRLYRHCNLHLQVAELGPPIAGCLKRVLKDERAHIAWVKRWLDGQVGAAKGKVAEALRRYSTADVRVHQSLCREHGVSWAA